MAIKTPEALYAVLESQNARLCFPPDGQPYVALYNGVTIVTDTQSMPLTLDMLVTSDLLEEVFTIPSDNGRRWFKFKENI